MIFYVALGSALGGAARLLVSRAIQGWWSFTFPAGTLVVNIFGAFVLGLVVRYALEVPTVSPELRAFLTTGFCGGFTTFSAFSYETATQLEDGNYARAAMYVVASVALSLVAVYLGFGLGRQLLNATRTG